MADTENKVDSTIGGLANLSNAPDDALVVLEYLGKAYNSTMGQLKAALGAITGFAKTAGDSTPGTNDVYTITFGNGGKLDITIPIPTNGKNGYTPQKGLDYNDGYTPQKGVDYNDGYTPQKGVDYHDGFSPTVEVKQVSDGAEITITDATGPHTATLKNGENGITPTFRVEEIEGGYRVIISAGNDYSTFDLYNGEGGDWSINSKLLPGYIKNRTHWKEVYGKDGEIIPEMTVEFGDLFNFNIVTGAISDAITVKGEYTVIWNGKSYDCIGKDSDDGPYIGNGSLIAPGVLDLENTGEPFCVLMYGGTYYQVFKETVEAGTATIKVDGRQVIIWHKLDENYLPDIIQGIASFKKLTEAPFDPRYCLRLEYPEAENDTATVYTDERGIIRYHRVSDLIPTREEVVGSIVEWSQIVFEAFYKLAVTEDMIQDTSFGEGFCINAADIWSDSTYPAAAIVVLSQPSESAKALGFKTGVYFLKVREQTMVNEWEWGGKRRINKALLPLGYPYYRTMETVLPKTTFDFSDSEEVQHDGISLTNMQWYLVTCDGIEYVMQAKRSIEVGTDALILGVSLGDPDLQNNPFAIKVTETGAATVYHESGADFSAVTLSVQRIIPVPMAEQYQRPKLVVRVTDMESEDDDGANFALMDCTLQDIKDAFKAGYEISCELLQTIGSNTVHILLPMTQIGDSAGGQVFFTGFGGGGTYYAVSTTIDPTSPVASFRKMNVLQIDGDNLSEKIEEVLS